MLNSLIYNLKSLVMRPVTLVTSPTERMSSESLRGRALVLGLPALLVAVLGISALCWAKFGTAEGLESHYRANAEKSRREKERLVEELNTELRMKRAAGQSEDQSLEALVPVDDPRRKEFEQLQTSEEVYWEKLISLDPEEKDYRYQLALVTLSKGDLHRGLSLMQAIAPLDKAGYPAAHLWLSRYFMGLRGKDQLEQNRILSMAFVHADLSLKRGPQNSKEGRIQSATAMLIKATLLFAQNKMTEAYDVYDELFVYYPEFMFENAPETYQRMILINDTLETQKRNKEVYNRVLQYYEQQFSSGELAVEKWVAAWTHVVNCLAGQGNFEEAEKRLKKEIERQNSDGVDGVVKRVFVEQLLASLYMNWLRKISTGSQTAATDLEFLKKAYRYNPSNPDVLRGLARIAISDDSKLSAAAREVYDPEKHPDPPASVLNELGSNALAKGNYEPAIRYFEMARKKSPQSSSILNNLAYTYLVCEDRNPERSLKLVDEAIRFLPADQQAKAVLSHFFDTRGNALMQMNRMTEAIASFEMAVQERPWNRSILDSLVKCYEGNNLDPLIYEERLKELDAREAAGEKVDDKGKNLAEPLETGEATISDQSNENRSADKN